MAEPDNRQVDRFLADHRAAIQQLIERAYQEAGGHYAALTPEQRTRQAAIDCGEFITDLLRGTPDREGIRQTMAAASAPTIAGDIVNMATALDRLFTGFVTEQLPGEARLAQELVLRSSYVIARFRLSVSASQLDNLVRGEDQPVPQARPRRS